jgi:hypothetical protein
MEPVQCRSIWSTGCLALVMWLLPAGELGSLKPLQAGDEPKAEAPADGEPVKEPVDERTAEKRRQAMAGLMAVSGILITGVMFLAVVVIWGARLRRLARRELPTQTTLQNDLWFLKPPKSSTGDLSSEAAEPCAPAE